METQTPPRTRSRRSLFVGVLLKGMSREIPPPSARCRYFVRHSAQLFERALSIREWSSSSRVAYFVPAREAQERFLFPVVLLKGMSREIPPLRLDADTLFGIQPNCLNVHSRFESCLSQAESLISFRRVKRRNVSSSLWFHTLAAAPFVSETARLTVIHFMNGNAWSYRRLVAYGFLGLSERA